MLQLIQLYLRQSGCLGFTCDIYWKKKVNYSKIKQDDTMVLNTFK